VFRDSGQIWGPTCVVVMAYYFDLLLITRYSDPIGDNFID